MKQNIIIALLALIAAGVLGAQIISHTEKRSAERERQAAANAATCENLLRTADIVRRLGIAADPLLRERVKSAGFTRDLANYCGTGGGLDGR